MTSVRITLHFEASLTRAKTCFGVDFKDLELKTWDLKDGRPRKGADS